MADILLIIPAHNEEKNIQHVVDQLVSRFSAFDYIIVNDGSTDQTAQICADRGYHVINLGQNLGLAGAFQTGMKYAFRNDYSYAVQFDGDGQHRPEFIDAMRQQMDKGYDIVIASRYVNASRGHSLRSLGSRLIQGAIRLTTGVKIQDPTSGMRMFNARMIGEFALNLNYGPEPDTVSYLIRQGAAVAEIPAVMDERMGGISYLTPWKAGAYMFRMLISILLIQNFRKRDYRYKRKKKKEG